MDQRLGWYNSIAAGDFDADGDMDYVVGNFGWNTKYHASPEKPTLLYYGDFENKGRSRLVEAEFEDETLFPVRGKSCSTNAMPFLGDKYDKFHDFAVASLQDIYTPKRLDSAHRYEANSLDSGVLINDGKGHFEFRSLPSMVQAAPVFGVTVDDVNNDGNCDLVLAQNFYGPQPETGRFDGGVSLLLTGNGDGTFKTVPPSDSGIVVPWDAKSLVQLDSDGDGVNELIFATNDGPCYSFERNGSTPRGRQIRVVGGKGNLDAVGTKILVRCENGRSTVVEISAGHGYLSQSPASISLPKGAQELEVTWPGGAKSTHKVESDAKVVKLSKPSDL